MPLENGEASSSGEQGSQPDNATVNTLENNANVDTRGAFISLDTACKLLTQYDGSKREFVTEFIDNCSMTLSSVRPADRALLFRIIKTKLTGKARNMIKYREFLNFDALAEHLENIFSEKRSVPFWQLELNSTKQGPNEDVASYSNKIEKNLSNLIDASTAGKSPRDSELITKILNEQALNIFKQNLKEPLRLQVKARNPSSLEEAIDLARSEERELLGNSNSTKFFHYRTSTNNDSIVCRNCNKKGHIARNCFSTKPNFNFKNNSGNRANVNAFNSINCHYCKRPGHKIADCRKRQFNEQARKNFNTGFQPKNGGAASEVQRPEQNATRVRELR